MPRNQYRNITTATTTVVSDHPCTLDGLIVNGGATNAVVTIYDSTSASGTKVGTIQMPSNTFGHVVYSVMLTRGLTVVTDTACDITVIYS